LIDLPEERLLAALDTVFEVALATGLVPTPRQVPCCELRV